MDQGNTPHEHLVFALFTPIETELIDGHVQKDDPYGTHHNRPGEAERPKDPQAGETVHRYLPGEEAEPLVTAVIGEAEL